MSTAAIRAAIEERAARAGLSPSSDLTDKLTSYIALLARWNARINLTALDLVGPSTEAIDRLVVEPLAALPLFKESDVSLLDIGSGNGSPALVICVALEGLRQSVLIESRSRKAAFLREAARELGLATRIENVRLADLRHEFDSVFDVVTMRGVRLDLDLEREAARLLSPAGRILFFERRGGIDRSSGRILRERSRSPLPVLDAEVRVLEAVSRSG